MVSSEACGHLIGLAVKTLKEADFLSIIQLNNVRTQLRDHYLDINGFDYWHEIHTQALAMNKQSSDKKTSERKARMNLVNPKYILRNHLTQNATEAALNGDYSKVKSFMRC